MPQLLIALPLLYISVLLFWAVVYYVTWTANRECFIGFFTFQSAFMFAVETQVSGSVAWAGGGVGGGGGGSEVSTETPFD